MRRTQSEFNASVSVSPAPATGPLTGPLLSRPGRWINGQLIKSDGGFSA